MSSIIVGYLSLMIDCNGKKAFAKNKNICKIIIKYNQKDILYLNSGIEEYPWPRSGQGHVMIFCFRSLFL